MVSIWSACSAKKCGDEEGVRKRKVLCVQGGSQADPGQCEEEQLPPAEEPCSAECPEDDGSASGSGSGDDSDAGEYKVASIEGTNQSLFM